MLLHLEARLLAFVSADEVAQTIPPEEPLQPARRKHMRSAARLVVRKPVLRPLSGLGHPRVCTLAFTASGRGRRGRGVMGRRVVGRRVVPHELPRQRVASLSRVRVREVAGDFVDFSRKRRAAALGEAWLGGNTEDGGGRDAAVDAENAVVDDGRDGERVECLVDALPHLGAKLGPQGRLARLFEARVVALMRVLHPNLMVAPEQRDLARTQGLLREQVCDHFQAVRASINIVPKKHEIRWVEGQPDTPQGLLKRDEVLVVSMQVAENVARRMHVHAPMYIQISLSLYTYLYI